MTENKTATGRLRELLDERGVEYETIGERCVEFGNVQVIEYADSGLLLVSQSNLTPEQAIAATLGSGERICKCGWHGFVDGWGFNPSSYCPRCGGKRVDE